MHQKSENRLPLSGMSHVNIPTVQAIFCKMKFMSNHDQAEIVTYET